MALRKCERCSGQMMLEVYKQSCRRCSQTGGTVCANCWVVPEYKCIQCGHTLNMHKVTRLWWERNGVEGLKEVRAEDIYATKNSN